MLKRVLVVLNASGMSTCVKGMLESEMFKVRKVEGLSDLNHQVVDFKPALVVFDTDGWDRLLEETLCQLRDLRVASHVRKIVLASKDSLDDRVDALEAGADDFLLKPISSRELSVRMDAVLRSYVAPSGEEDQARTVGDLHLHREVMEVSFGTRRARLTPIEFHLLEYFMDQAGHVLSRDELMENIWFPRSETEERRVVDVYVCRLREKIEETPSEPRRLLTRRGGGYILVHQANETHQNAVGEDISSS
jgi:two-component system response regulator VicR